MNYFEFYDIPVKFGINKTELKAKYFELSKKYHPDFHTMSDSKEQERILELSTYNNDAYRVLSNDRRRTLYILELNGYQSGSDKDAFPQDFLIEMMDINESLMELEFDMNPDKLNAIHSEIDQLSDEIEEKALYYKTLYDQNNMDKTALETIKMLHLKSKYIERLKERTKSVMNT